MREIVLAMAVLLALAFGRRLIYKLDAWLKIIFTRDKRD